MTSLQKCIKISWHTYVPLAIFSDKHVENNSINWQPLIVPKKAVSIV